MKKYFFFLLFFFLFFTSHASPERFSETSRLWNEGINSHELSYLRQAYSNEKAFEEGISNPSLSEGEEAALRLSLPLTDEEIYRIWNRLQKAGKPHPDILYSRGLAAYLLSHQGKNAAWSEEVISCWSLLISQNRSLLAKKALFDLATVHYQHKNDSDAESLYFLYGTRYPDDPRTGEAWFYASLAAERNHRPQAITATYRQNAIDSSSDPSFYALYHSTTQEDLDPYLEGLIDRYPFTPTAYYAALWRAYHCTSYETSLRFFQEANRQYQHLPTDQELTQPQKLHLYQTRVESYVPWIETLLEKAELSAPSYRPTYLTQAQILIPSLSTEEEVPLLKARLAYLENRVDEAWELLVGYTPPPLHKNQWLALTAQIHMHQGQYEEARATFDQIDPFPQGRPLTLAYCRCLKHQGELGEAMRQLSALINRPITPDLRLEAMFERAEIYLAQKRKTLALKQLETLSSAEDEWGTRARNLSNQITKPQKKRRRVKIRQKK